MAIVIIDLLNDDDEEENVTIEKTEDTKLIENVPRPQLQIVEVDEIKSPSYHEIFSV